MRRRLLLCLSLPALLGATAGAQSGPPPTDIFVAPLSVTGDRLAIGTPVQITTWRGYDNQPSFTPDGRSILYTSVREDEQADIYRYDLRARRSARLTRTNPESEYSAVVMPGGKRFSVVRVERDSTQRLWSFALDGSHPRVAVENVKPVGYYAWIDSAHVAAFVLGRPNALVRVDLHTGQVDTLARNIGRSIARLPDGSGFSYVQMHDSSATLVAMRGSSASDLVALPRRAEDVVWLRSGVVLASSASKIYAWRAGDAEWTELADLASRGLTAVSRMAVSPDGRSLAIVAERQSR